MAKMPVFGGHPKCDQGLLWPCTQELSLAVLGGPCEIPGIKPKSAARQVPYPRYYLAGPKDGFIT